MSQLVLFQLIGGHELIGKKICTTGNGFILEHPLVIRPIQKAPGQYALDLFPHSLANPEGQHTFYDSAIVSISVEIPKMLTDAYNERTSAIILAGAIDAFEKLGNK